MKKTITLALVSIVLISSQASAQLKKGEKMLGGNIGWSSQKYKNEASGFPSGSEQKQTAITILPQLGFGLGNNWIAGIILGWDHTKYDQYGETNNVNIYQVGAFARKFHPLGSDRFGFFGEAALTYGYGTAEFKSSAINTERRSNNIGASLTPGAYCRISKKYIIEATIGGIQYMHAVSKPKTNAGAQIAKSTGDVFNLSLTDNLSLGFKIVL